MIREELIKNLKYTMKKHEHDRVDTFGTNISLMCKDMLDYLEKEPKQVELEGDGYADGEFVYDYGKCPSCGWDFEDGDKDWREPYCCHCGQKLKWFEEDEKALDFVIKLLEQKPRKGKWIEITVRGSMSLVCSECGADLGSICETNFCPNCGANMRESENKK